MRTREHCTLGGRRESCVWTLKLTWEVSEQEGQVQVRLLMETQPQDPLASFHSHQDNRRQT